MQLFQRNVISVSIVKAKSNKIKAAALREAKKQIKYGELTDSHDLALYLSTIDDRFTQIKTDIENASNEENYPKFREQKMTQTKKLLEFSRQEDVKLRGLYSLLVSKAKEAGLTDGLKGEALTTIDLTKLKASFEALEREDT